MSFALRACYYPCHYYENSYFPLEAYNNTITHHGIKIEESILVFALL